jgi:hypothetical protein
MDDEKGQSVSVGSSNGSGVRRMTVHMSQSIIGPLRNWSPKQWRDATEWITKLDGSKYTAEGLKAVFEQLYAEGKHCFPIGDCNDFDYKHGCRGHPITAPDHQNVADEPRGKARPHSH